jgi:hypothetical protein
LADKVCRIGEGPASRFLAQFCGTLPEAAAPWTQGLFEDDAVFGFRAAAMLGGASLQRFDNILRHVSDEQLRQPTWRPSRKSANASGFHRRRFLLLAII